MKKSQAIPDTALIICSINDLKPFESRGFTKTCKTPEGFGMATSSVLSAWAKKTNGTA
jgi:hypothetical protein